MSAAPILGIRLTTKLVDTWLAEAVGDEKKQRPESRRALLCPVTLSRGDSEVRALCRDMSRQEIRLIQSDGPPDEGIHTVTIWLNQFPVKMPVEIRWVESLGGNWWASGGSVPKLTMFEWFEIVRHRFRNQVQSRLQERHVYCKRYFALPGREGSGYQEDALAWSDDAVTVGGGSSRLYLRGNPMEAITKEDALAVTAVMSLDISSGGIRVLSERPLFEEGHYTYLENVDRPETGLVRGRIVTADELDNGYFTADIEFAPSFV